MHGLPSLSTDIRDLYGSSGYRIGEKEAYDVELDGLDQQEKRLEQILCGLVQRQAPQPIGLKFHRDQDEGDSMQQLTLAHGNHLEDEDDMEEEEAEEVEDEVEEEEEEEDDDDDEEGEQEQEHILLDEDEQDPFRLDEEGDSMQDTSMDLDASTEEW
jgi:hypothetical protein